MQPQDPVAVRCAAAFQREVVELEAKLRCSLTRQRIGTALRPAAQIDQRAQTQTRLQAAQAGRRRVIAAIDLARNDRRQIAPDQAEHRVVDEQRVNPGDRTAFARAKVTFEDRVHARVGQILEQPTDMGMEGGHAQRLVFGNTAAAFQTRRKSRVRGCSRDTRTLGSRIGPGVRPNGKNRARRRASASLALTGRVP